MSSFDDPNMSYRFSPVVERLEFRLWGWNMTFSDTEMKELGRGTQINIHNTRSFIRALKYVQDISQTEETFTVEENKYIHTHTQPAFICSKSTAETPEQCVEYIQC